MSMNTELLYELTQFSHYDQSSDDAQSSNGAQSSAQLSNSAHLSDDAQFSDDPRVSIDTQPLVDFPFANGDESGNGPPLSTQMTQNTQHSDNEVKKKEKKALLSLADTLLPISTFAGAFTLNAYFNSRCPGSFTATLLHSASILFLSAPLGLLMVHILLSGLPEDEPIPRGLLRAVMHQLDVAGLMLAVAILYVSLAFYFYIDQPTAAYLGIGGIIMVGFMVIVALLYGIVGTIDSLLTSFPGQVQNNDVESPTSETSPQRVVREIPPLVRANETNWFRKVFHSVKSLNLFRPDWKNIRTLAHFFNIAEFLVLYIFIFLSALEMSVSSRQCVVLPS